MALRGTARAIAQRLAHQGSGRASGRVWQLEGARRGLAGSGSAAEQSFRHRSAVSAGLLERWRAKAHLIHEEQGTDPVLVPKAPRESYLELTLPFSTDTTLRSEYLTFQSNIRVGRLLEDLDALAGTIAYEHCDDGVATSRPLTVVTASVDRITLLAKLLPTKDYRISGKVCYVGSSSMEVQMAVDTPTDEPDGAGFSPVLRAAFTMVARDPLTGRAHKVNPLVPETEEDAVVYEASRARQLVRREWRDKSLSKVPPTEEERFVIHDLHLKTLPFVSGKQRQRADGFVWMEDTAMQSMRMCHPQEQNIHGKIFGGYLMREAFELAWCTASLHSGTPIFFLGVDDITFRAPVEIGAVLEFTSRVTYCPGKPSQSLIVSVWADVLDVGLGGRTTTNVFHFTFTSPKEVQAVMPFTYNEAMLHINSRRRFQAFREDAKGGSLDRFFG